MVFIAGGTLAFFFEFLLLSKRPKYLSDRILAIWMLILGFHLFIYYINLEGIVFKYPHLLGILNFLPLLHGPLLFLYTGALTNYFKRWKAKYLLHFTPVLIFIGHYFNFYISSGQEKIEFYKKMAVSPDYFNYFVFPAIIISGFTYVFLTFLLFKKHKKNIENNLSNFDGRNNLHWLRNLIVGLLAIWIVVILSAYVFGPADKSMAIYFTVTLFVASMGYFGLRQGNIFIHIPSTTLQTNINADSEPVSLIIEQFVDEQRTLQQTEAIVEEQQRYSKSGLKEEQADELLKELLKLMEEKKLFLDENISLPQLAAILNIHPNYLSQVINEKLKKNFYDFINTYRIEEFKRIVALEKSKNKTFFALALDCGFSSKASFNNSFKKITGITPSEYVKSV